MAKNGVRIATDPNSNNPWGAANGNLTVDGGAAVGGTIRAGSTISTSTGYGIIDNRSVNPNQLSGGHVQLGFGSMANNGTAPFADTIHLNGWGDASGQRPNLVMFDKSKPGMRIYQGDWNSTSPYTTYNDAVMADSGGNASIGGALSAGSIKTGGALSAGSISTGGALSAGATNVSSLNVGSIKGGGILNLGNGWELRTVDGVLRFYKDNDQKAAIHGDLGVGNEWNDVMYSKGGFRTGGPLMTGSWNLQGSDGAGNSGDLSISNTRGNGTSNAFMARFDAKIWKQY
jgi:hypothetical protein